MDSRPAYKSIGFWSKVASALLGLLLASGVVKDPIVLQWLGVAATLLPSAVGGAIAKLSPGRDESLKVRIEPKQ